MYQTQPNFNRPIHQKKTKDVVFNQYQVKMAFNNQIHKTPQSIRKSIKIGKHKRHARIISKFQKQKPFQNLNDSPHSQVEKQKLSMQINARQIFNFQNFSIQDQQARNSLKQFRQKKSFLQNRAKQLLLTNQDKISATDRIQNIRKKLSPLKKGSSTGDKNHQDTKRILKITFLNIQKVPLVNMYDHLQQKNQSEEEVSPKKNKAKYSLDCGFQSAYNKSAFDKNQKQFLSQSTGFSSFKKRVPLSEDIGFNTSTLKFKKFKVPFQRYVYRDFLWKCAFSNGIRFQCQKDYQKKFKIFIGRGNNSLLIKSLFKKRNWWTITDKYQEANLIWTQIKITDIFRRQASHPNHLKQQSYTTNCFPNANPSYKKKSTYQHNKKILNEHDLQKFYQYFQRHQRLQQKIDQTMIKRNRHIKKQNLSFINLKTIRIHNHLPNNYVIGNKKALYYTMNAYYQKTGEDIFSYLPLTFHIQNGLQDDQYSKFLNKFYEKQKSARRDQSQVISGHKKQKSRNIWIVKPGQFTNRGNGINVCLNLQQIKTILKRKEKHDNGNLKTYIIQSYLDKPFLYQRRKFDIRHYMMITSFNGRIKGYWCDLGYIRTTSSEYTVKNGLSSIHLTNDAVQKYLPQYGKYEKGNKLSYDLFQKYLDKQYDNRYNFMEDVYPIMKKIATDSIKACALVIDPQRKDYNFQVFGLDFMIDQTFKPWLIEINNNPCLQLSCPILRDLIPQMVQNCFKICIDPMIPPPASFEQKRPHFQQDYLQKNRFEIVYDSVIQQEGLCKLFKGQNYKDNISNLKQFDQDDQVFQDDGDQIQD